MDENLCRVVTYPPRQDGQELPGWVCAPICAGTAPGGATVENRKNKKVICARSGVFCCSVDIRLLSSKVFGVLNVLLKYIPSWSSVQECTFETSEFLHAMLKKFLELSLLNIHVDIFLSFLSAFCLLRARSRKQRLNVSRVCERMLRPTVWIR